MPVRQSWTGTRALDVVVVSLRRRQHGGDATAVAEEVGVGRRRRRVCDHHRLLEEAEVREGHPRRFVPGEQEQASHDGEAHRAGNRKTG